MRSRVTAASAFVLFIGPVAGCGDEPSDQSATATGDSQVSDIPCDNQNGCLRGDVEFDLKCAAPDDGSGVTSWNATFSASAGPGGSCVVTSSTAEANTEERIRTLVVGFGDVNYSAIALWVKSFSGGGSYTLRGNSSTGEGEQLNVNAKGYRDMPDGTTDADTLDTCSPGCVLDVLPPDREPVEGDWVTYRFVVSCEQPLGLDDCGQCVMSPTSFTLDAACYIAPPQF